MNRLIPILAWVVISVWCKTLQERDVIAEDHRIIANDEEECQDAVPYCSKIKDQAGSDWSKRCMNSDILQDKCIFTCDMCNGENPSEPETTTQQINLSSDEVEECNSDVHSCECGDPASGFQTFVIKICEDERCFTVYRPTSRAGEKLSVVLSQNCYANDRLSGLHMIKEDTDENLSAARYGYARFGLSTPDGHWTFGNDGVVNTEIPMPCSEEDSKDIPYVRAVFNFIENNPDAFDVSSIYAEGFSQNSMFSAYIGFCFPDKVVGIWQGGSGMALTGQLPNLPACQGQCRASVYVNMTSCDQCIEEEPCTECEYWPIYPCHNKKRAMIDCLAEYNNDFISVSREDPAASSATYMYSKLKKEGHDGRLLRFAASDDGTVPGGHQNPVNKAYWQVGCLGITPSCSTECESSFLQCVEEGDTITADSRTETFAACMELPYFSEELYGCTASCAPTLEMLKASEEPIEIELSRENFGAVDTENIPRPTESMCTI